MFPVDSSDTLGAVFAAAGAIYSVVILGQILWIKIINHPIFFQWRLDHQDYGVDFCKMSLVSKDTGETHYIVDFVGLKFGDFLTLRVERPRPPVEWVYHLRIDRSKPKKIYWLAKLEDPHYDDEYELCQIKESWEDGSKK